MNSGIYFITCEADPRVYIGLAKNFDRRQRDHWASLRKGTHVNAHLQKAWNLHGEASFSFIRKVYCKPEDLVDTEQRFLQAYKPVEEMFNIRQCPGAPSIREASPLSNRFTDESTILKMIDAKGTVSDSELVRQCRSSMTCKFPSKSADTYAMSHTSEHMRKVFFEQFRVIPV